jgi:hypothetical protein
MSLIAELEIQPVAANAAEQLRAVCSIANAGEDVEELNLSALSSPSLLLEIRTRGGDPVHLPPPPVPPASPSTAPLGPGEQQRAEFPGFFPSWMEPGEYEARCRYVSGSVVVHSPWVAFTLLEV